MDHSSGHISSGFITGPGTPIWTPGLTPLSEAEYIGALFGLFLLAVGFRGLMAAQSYLEAFLHLRYHPDPKPSSLSHRRPVPPYSPRSNDQQQPQQQQQQEQALALSDPRQDEKNASQDPSPPSHGNGANCPPSLTNGQSFSSSLDEKLTLSRTPTVIPPATSSSSPTPPTALSHKTCAVAATTTAATAPLPNATSPSIPFYNAEARKRQRKQADAALYGFSSSQQHHHRATVVLPTVKPFVWQVEVSRALLATVVVAVGYLLMLVIMTYHWGYIGTILTGIFVGDVFFGRWARVRAIPPEWERRDQQRADRRRRHRRHHVHPSHQGSQGPPAGDGTREDLAPPLNQRRLSSLSTRSSLSSLAWQDRLRLASEQHHQEEMVC